MHLLVNHSIRPLPSSFGKRVRAIQSGSLATNKPKRCKMFERIENKYEPIIICINNYYTLLLTVIDKY